MPNASRSSTTSPRATPEPISSSAAAARLTVAELAAVGVGAIIVPLPGAIADEQSANARFLVDAGAAVMVPQAELTSEALAARIAASTRDSLLAMAIAARKVARPDAADRVADACIAMGTPR